MEDHPANMSLVKRTFHVLATVHTNEVPPIPMPFQVILPVDSAALLSTSHNLCPFFFFPFESGHTARQKHGAQWTYHCMRLT